MLSSSRWQVLSRFAPLTVAMSLACAGRAPVVERPRAAPDAPATAPPAFVPQAAPSSRAEVAVQAALKDSRSPWRSSRPQIFEATWTTIRDKHYDAKLGGLDWSAVGARYRPRALGAPDEPTFYRVLNEMLGELRQSHLFITGPGDEPEGARHLDADEVGKNAAPVTSKRMGDPGLVVRSVEGQPVVTEVRPGSPAAAAGLRPGNVITHIGGLALGTARSRVALRPVEEKFQLRRMALRQLSGPAGTTVTIRYAGDDKRPAEAVLLRQPIATAPERVGHLGPVYPRVSVRQVGHVGIIAFNFFLMEPVLKKVSDAIEGFRQRKVTAIVLDLRGNPGGMAAMAIPLAARLSAKPVALGTIQFRDHQNALTANPSLDVQPFLGPVFILTDEGTASTAEILAAGLQEAKRATIVGELTLGAALPSAVEELPGGAVLQYVVADFKTPSGAALEGRGVAPDRRVVETRAALAAGRDVVLDAALELARASRTR